MPSHRKVCPRTCQTHPKSVAKTDKTPLERIQQYTKRIAYTPYTTDIMVASTETQKSMRSHKVITKNSLKPLKTGHLGTLKVVISHSDILEKQAFEAETRKCGGRLNARRPKPVLGKQIESQNLPVGAPKSRRSGHPKLFRRHPRTPRS